MNARYANRLMGTASGGTIEAPDNTHAPPGSFVQWLRCGDRAVVGACETVVGEVLQQTQGVRI
jgi:hypothetical protein